MTHDKEDQRVFLFSCRKKSGNARLVSCLIGLLRRSLMTLTLLQAGLKVWQIIRIAHIDLNGQTSPCHGEGPR